MINQFDREDWKLYGRWMQPPLSSYFWTPSTRGEKVRKIIQDFVVDPVIMLDGYTFDSVGNQKLMHELISRLDREGKIDEFQETYEKHAIDAENEHLAVLTKDKTDVLGYLRDLFKTYQACTGPWWISVLIADALQDLIFEKGLAKDESDLIDALAPLHQETWLEARARKAKEVIDMVNAHPEKSNLLKEHVEEFEWYGTHHWMGDPYTEAKARESVAFEGSSVNTHKGVGASHPLIGLLARMMYWRTHFAEATAKVVFESRSVLTEAAHMIGLDYEGLLYLNYPEILSLLESGSKKLPADYKERFDGHGSYMDKEGKIHIVVGKELQSLIDFFVPKVEKVLEFKGTPASKRGTVTGTVRVVLSPKDFSSFKEGDILVASETSPDYIPLMSLASAIVTDTGGVTSHAAIVSREMGKVCVIGTKIGTQILKDGDTVEVDAEKGIVRIIK